MKIIELTHGKQAKVDDDLYEWLSQWRWYAKINTTTGKYYAARTANGVKGHQNLTIRMHNQVLPPHPGCVIDHIDVDTLNNQRHNLRQATSAHNGHNRPVQKNNITGLKGVSWHERDKHYRVQIRIGNNQRIVKGFKELKQAIKFRDETYRKYHKEYTRIS